MCLSLLVCFAAKSQVDRKSRHRFLQTVVARQNSYPLPGRQSNTGLCTGSLGDPVVNITFGSGDNPGSPIEIQVPGASTTLDYIAVTGNPARPTPFDGQYTITNNVPFNSAWFVGAHDHTGNPNGYMAFYNASEQPGEFYKQSISNLCGVTTYEFAAWVANCLDPAKIVGMKPDITFRIERTDGTVLGTYNTGPIPQQAVMTWQQFGFYFTTPSNIGSVVLKMVNNNPGGAANVGNDFAIDDITFRACGPTLTASFDPSGTTRSFSACAGATISLYGATSPGYVDPGFLWQLSKDGGATWNDIPSSNALQMQVAGPAQNTTWLYRMLSGEGNNISSVNCRIVSNVIKLTTASIHPDFAFQQEACHPLSIQFFNSDNAASYPFFSFGDGTQMAGNPTPVHDFAGPGNYTIKLTAGRSGCNDTVTKTISIGPVNDKIILTPDTTVCSGGSKQLRTVPAMNFCWWPTTYLNDPNSPQPISTPERAITYHFNASITDADKVVNGNFSAGNSGFNSDYHYAGTGSQSGSFFIGSNPASWNSGMSPCSDHTTSSGNMLIVNGDSQAGAHVWSQTVDIAPNTNYLFSVWLQSLAATNPARLRFSINGNRMGNPLQAGNTTCSWSRFSIIWNSGSSTTAVIAIDNANTATNGNEFALDDISFAPIRIRHDSVTLTVGTPPVVRAKKSNDIDCLTGTSQLTAIGARSYAWTPATGLDHPNKSNPIASIDTTTTFFVTGRDNAGCSATDTVTVFVTAKGKATFALPNAFTPNGDGHNDCFGIQHWGNVTVEEFSIFTRWGEKLFTTTDPHRCWDGSYKGKTMDAGTYVYVIRARSFCGPVKKSGVVLLIR